MDYRPQVNPELFYHCKRAGMSRREISMYVCLLCCEQSRNAPHGLFRYNTADFAFFWCLTDTETTELFRRFGEVELNGRPAVIADNNLLFIPEIPESRRFPEAHKTVYILRTINNALRNCCYIPSEFPDTDGFKTQINRAYAAFSTAHFNLIRECIAKNEAEAKRKREEREKDENNTPETITKSREISAPAGNISPSDLPVFVPKSSSFLP
jgi:hypothetical protein